MKELKDYKKKPRQGKQVIVSCAITREQKEFIDKHDINTSVLIRDAIDELIEKSKPDK